MTEDLRKLSRQTQDVYERNAAIFDQCRARDLHEKGWLDRFIAGMPAGAHILDLGCGAGDPIATYLTNAGLVVMGIDASAPMIELARNRAPTGDWQIMDMRDLTLTETFDGIIGWNSFFHLTRDEQRALLPQLTALLAPGGRLMLTVGYSDGEVTGHVGGDLVYHASLAPETYRAILNDLGCDVLSFVVNDATCNGHSVLLAQSHKEKG